MTERIIPPELAAVLPASENALSSLPGLLKEYKDVFVFFAYSLENETFEFENNSWEKDSELDPDMVNYVKNLLAYLNGSPYLIDKYKDEKKREELRDELTDKSEVAAKIYAENKLRLNKITVVLDAMNKIMDFLFAKLSPDIVEDLRKSLASFQYVTNKDLRTIWKKESGEKPDSIPEKPDDVPDDVDFHLWYSMLQESDAVSFNTEKKIEYVRTFLIKRILAILRLVEKYIKKELTNEDSEYVAFIDDLYKINLDRLRKIAERNRV